MTDARSIPGRENCRAESAESCRGKKVGAHCRSCLMIARRADPEAEARRVASLQANFNPERREARSAAMKAMHARKKDDPAHVEMLRRSGHRLQRILQIPEVRAKRLAPETLARRGRTYSNRRMAWCPLEYRDMARALVTKGVATSAQAKRLVKEQIKIDRERYIKTGQLQATKGDAR